jgi:RNA recognition motif-containing protein
VRNRLNELNLGQIEEIALGYGKSDEKKAASASVKFKYRPSAVNALWTLREQCTDWRVQWNDLKVDKPISIYVGNLKSKLVTENTLLEKFKEFGDIKACKILPKDNNTSFAFLDFNRFADAKKAVDQMNNTEWLGIFK